MGTTILNMSEASQGEAYELASNLSYYLKRYSQNNEDDHPNNELSISDGYKKHSGGWYHGRQVILSYDRKFERLSSMKITFHLSQWDNLRELFDFFCNVFNETVAKRIFFESIVNRIDFWVDFKGSFLNVEKTLDRPKSASMRQYAKKKFSTYFGTKKNKEVILYEKTESLLRLEVRYFRRDCPIRYLHELYSLKDYSPFSVINSYKIKKGSINQISLNTKTKEFLKLYRTEGFHRARIALNKERNFSRILLPKLKPYFYKVDFSKIWRSTTFKMLTAQQLEASYERL